MGKFEQKINSILQELPVVKKYIKRIYQLIMYSISSKIKYEGDLSRITPDDEYEYFFGYYDKSPWDASERYMLCIRVKNAYINADSDEEAQLILIDTKANNDIRVLTKTYAWNVQQGCMLQWLGPEYTEKVIYNDFRDNSLCAVILNIKTRDEKVLPMPIYSVSSDGTFALTLDFTRLHRMRPGYGYCNLAEPTQNDNCPDTACIWKEYLDTGKCVELLKYTDFVNFEQRNEMKNAKHKINHLMISPNGKRFIVLHRWFMGQRKFTRLITCNCDGSDMFNLLDDNFVSHCYWKNDSEIITFAEKRGEGRGYFLLMDKEKRYKHLWHNLVEDGHPSYGPDGLVVTDTYPDSRRISKVYILNEKLENTRVYAKVFAPFRYDNDVRCDLHPRWSRNGKSVCIDSAFSGKRALYTLNVKQDQKSNKSLKVMLCLRKCVNKGPVHQTYNILNNIDKSNIDPMFFTMKKEDSKNTIYEKFNKLGIETYFIDGTAFNLVKGIIFGKGQVIDKIESAHPDIIHTTGIIVDLIGYRAAKKMNIKQVATIRNYVYDDYIRKFGKVQGSIIAMVHLAMMKKLNRRCKFVCCSESLAKKYYQLNGIKMDFIRNGVEVKRFNSECGLSKSEYRYKLNIPQNGFIVITVAQVIKRKNIDETIIAVPNIINGKEAYFVLVGDGSELEMLKSRFENHNNIIFAGKQTNVEEWLKASDVFVSSSESEGLPNSVIEAMAMGLPVILSDISQHKELFELNPNIGYMYSLYNTIELRDRMSNINDEWIKISGLNGRQLAVTELSDIRMSNQYQVIYKELIC